MERILGLDYGDKRIGVAISDPLKITAQGLEIINRPNIYTIKPAVARIKEIIREYQVSTIVLGYPLNMDGTIGTRAKITLDFKERLHRNFKKIQIVLEDERLSSKAVEKVLNPDKNTYTDHAVAAYILQGYLNRIGV